LVVKEDLGSEVGALELAFAVLEEEVHHFHCLVEGFLRVEVPLPLALLYLPCHLYVEEEAHHAEKEAEDLLKAVLLESVLDEKALKVPNCLNLRHRHHLQLEE